MSDFGDEDPEDAFDASDPPEERLRVLTRVVASMKREKAGTGEMKVADREGAERRKERHKARYDAAKAQLYVVLSNETSNEKRATARSLLRELERVR
jgi:hypothetical protein